MKICLINLSWYDINTKQINFPMEWGVRAGSRWAARLEQLVHKFLGTMTRSNYVHELKKLRDNGTIVTGKQIGRAHV